MRTSGGGASDADPPILLTPDSGAISQWLEIPRLQDEGRDCGLDLSHLLRAEPHLVTRLAAWLDIQRRAGHEVHVLPPIDAGVAQDLTRAGLIPAPNGAIAGAPVTGSLESDSSWLGATRLTSADQIEPLALTLDGMLVAQFSDQHESVAQAMVLAFQELCDNATTHGRSSEGAFVAARSDASDRCALAIGDLGIGMPAHIRRTHRELHDDGAAIAYATRAGTTGTLGGVERGDGYRALLGTIRRGEVPTTDLQIWSANGRHHMHVRGGAAVKSQTQNDAPYTPGTWISLEMRSA